MLAPPHMPLFAPCPTKYLQPEHNCPSFLPAVHALFVSCLSFLPRILPRLMWVKMPSGVIFYQTERRHQAAQQRADADISKVGLGWVR